MTVEESPATGLDADDVDLPASATTGREPTASELADAEAAYQDVRKSPGLAYAFWFFLGIFGAHRFYLGDIRRGVAMLLTLGGLGVWTLVDVVFIGGRLAEGNADRRDQVFRSRGLKTGPRPAVAPAGPAQMLVQRLLAGLLVLLVAAAAFLWFTRPDPSAVRTGDYVGALQAARSGVVDMTSFDYLTLDDDIEQIRRVATGDLRDQAVQQLDSRRQAITDAQTVVNTEVVGAGVTRADGSDATVLLVIQSTQESAASDQAQIVRYRIQVDLVKQSDRWVLSSIAGTEQP
jgi:Mce-associated membrane protein